MLTTTRAFCALSLLLIGTCFVSADIRLPKIFSDNMVLQRDAAVRIWGTADPGEELTISLGESNCPATADEAGRWSAELAPPETGGPYKLSVEGTESSVVFSEVYVGEVWVCVGESNMQRSLNQSLEFPDDAAREVWMQEIDNANIRLFTVPENVIDEPTADFTEAVSWQKCRGKDVGDFSAVAYFFALALQKNETLKEVPIGLINVTLGGSTAEAWASRDALSAVDSLQPMMEFWNDNPDKRSAARPSSSYNGMLAPLVRFGIRGVIWYQGETNVGRGQQYREILTALISDWRAKFQLGDFPFYLVQLNPYRYTDWDPKSLPEIWDAQTDVLKLPNTEMVGTSDIGDPKQLYPRNKEIIGQRLAGLALSGTYGIPDLISSGPRYESMEVIPETKRIRVQFSNSAGLKQQGDQLTGFTICGKDGEFVPGNATIEDGAVVVWSDEISEPSHVRYLWQDASSATLFNGAGLPATPFRTDKFKLLSEGRHF